MKRDDFDEKGMQTTVIHAGRELNRMRAVSPTIWQTTAFTADSPQDFADFAPALEA